MSLEETMKELDEKAKQGNAILDRAADDRRVRILRFPSWGFHGLLSGRADVTGGIPSDARIEAIHYEPESDCFLFRIVHPSYEPVPPCHRIPDDLNLIVSQVR
jgi:hypothetical protein